MSFEIKYDRDGVPLKNQPMQEVTPPETAAVEPVESVEMQTEPAQPEVEVKQSQEVEDRPADIVEEAPVQAVAKQAPQESWKAIRDKMAAQEKRNKELEEALKAAQSKTKETYSESDEDLSLDLDEDALAEGKHLKKVDRRFQKMEEQLKRYEAQAAQAALTAKLKAQYPDWDTVYNEENLARLQVQEPEIFHALNSSSDAIYAGVSAYKMIKQMGIAAPQDTYTQEKSIAQRNAAKPRSLASISPQQGDSPLSKANAFANGTVTDDLKKTLWQEMNAARKGY